jgi:hypothetical protein
MHKILAPAIFLTPVDRQVGRGCSCVHWRPTDSYEASGSWGTHYSKGHGYRSPWGPLDSRSNNSGLEHATDDLITGARRRTHMLDHAAERGHLDMSSNYRLGCPAVYKRAGVSGSWRPLGKRPAMHDWGVQPATVALQNATVGGHLEIVQQLQT